MLFKKKLSYYAKTVLYIMFAPKDHITKRVLLPEIMVVERNGLYVPFRTTLPHVLVHCVCRGFPNVQLHSTVPYYFFQRTLDIAKGVAVGVNKKFTFRLR